MTDKEKIRAEIERLYNQSLADEKIRADRGLHSARVSYGKSKACKELLSFIDSLQEEPISDDLEQAIDTYLATYFGGEKEKQDWPFLKKMAIHFANWQKDQLMAKAIDGEVGYWNLRGLSINTDLPRSVSEGDKVKIIVIKED